MYYFLAVMLFCLLILIAFISTQSRSNHDSAIPIFEVRRHERDQARRKERAWRTREISEREWHEMEVQMIAEAETAKWGRRNGKWIWEE